jgi:Transposase IS66 family
VLTPDADPGTGEPETGSPHILVIHPPGGKLTWLRALGSRRAGAITAILGFFTGFLITDGYTAYQQMLPKLAGIQQSAQHVIRRCRAVTKLGPSSLQSWAADVIEILREAHRLTEESRARARPADAERLAKLRQRYDQAAAFGITHNRHRDWHDSNHPGYVLGRWLRDYADQVWLFTREPAVECTNNLSEQGAKAAKRHQAVSGYWHNQRTLARWCRTRSYLDSAAAHGLTALEAVTAALTGKPWLPLPAVSAAAWNRSSRAPLNGHPGGASRPLSRSRCQRYDDVPGLPTPPTASAASRRRTCGRSAARRTRICAIRDPAWPSGKPRTCSRRPIIGRGGQLGGRAKLASLRGSL